MLPGQISDTPNSSLQGGDDSSEDDDIVEIPEADPLADCGDDSRGPGVSGGEQEAVMLDDSDLEEVEQEDSFEEEPKNGGKQDTPGEVNREKNGEIEEMVIDDESDEEGGGGGDSAENSSNSKDKPNSTIVVNDTKSLAELANKKETQGDPTSKPTLVIIDTNSILSGKGPIPVQSRDLNGSSANRGSKPHVVSIDTNGENGFVTSSTASSSNSSTSLGFQSSSPVTYSRANRDYGAGGGGVNLTGFSPSGKYLPQTHAPTQPLFSIPDDAFLIEAPSFIVPYVFEQNGESSVKEHLKELEEKIKIEKKRKEDAGEELDYTDEIPVSKTSTGDKEDYFESPVGKLLMGLGMNLVQEYVQIDLLKMQKRKAAQEKRKNRGGMPHMHTQQSIISLKQNIEESKENNEPFRHEMKKCELCNFKSESGIVMATHLETPHMKNYSYRCNYCSYMTRVPQEILFHTEAEHCIKSKLERAPAYHQCPNCQFEDNSKPKLTRHLLGCMKRFRIERNLEPPFDWDTPAKLPKIPKNKFLGGGNFNSTYLSGSLHATVQQHQQQRTYQNSAASGRYIQNQQMVQQGRGLPPLMQAPGPKKPIPGLIRTNPQMHSSVMNNRGMMGNNRSLINQQMLQKQMGASGSNLGMLNKMGMMQNNMSITQNQRNVGMNSQMPRNNKSSQPSISITPLPRGTATSQQIQQQQAAAKAGGAAQGGGKTSFVICEICDGYIKDLDQLRNHMQWIHKVKIHPKMIYNKPPLNCQKCQFRFFTDQGLERHLLGSHGLVTSSMQEAANKGQDSGRCPLCGKVYQWKLLSHVAKDHNVTLKPAHLSYKCTVCTATFGMYKLFESHVYSAHSMGAKKGAASTETGRREGGGSTNKANLGGFTSRNSQMSVTPSNRGSSGSGNSYKPLKINDEITIIPQPLANSSHFQKKKIGGGGSLTITPQQSEFVSRKGRDEDEEIQIIEINDPSPKKAQNGVSINDSIRKRNLEISVCDSDNSDELYISESPPQQPSKRIRTN